MLEWRWRRLCGRGQLNRCVRVCSSEFTQPILTNARIRTNRGDDGKQHDKLILTASILILISFQSIFSSILHYSTKFKTQSSAPTQFEHKPPALIFSYAKKVLGIEFRFIARFHFWKNRNFSEKRIQKSRSLTMRNKQASRFPNDNIFLPLPKRCVEKYAEKKKCLVANSFISFPHSSTVGFTCFFPLLISEQYHFSIWFVVIWISIWMSHVPLVWFISIAVCTNCILFHIKW